MFRVALLGIYHESNTFIAQPTTLRDFENSHYLEEEQIISEYRSAHHEIGGMIETLEKYRVEIVPILFAEATPGGIIDAESYRSILHKMFSILEKKLPVDGCLVVPHGAGVAEEHADMDGHWLSLLRKKLGRHIPVIGTLDPHANVSSLMAASTDGLIAYSTNPHIDQRETGKKAADLLIRTLEYKTKPFQQLVQTPIAISIEKQYTSAEPCKAILSYIQELEKKDEILSISLLLGFPYADVQEMGSSFLVITNNNKKLAEDTGKLLFNYLLSVKEKCVGEKKDILEIIPDLKKLPAPILLLDMGDNVGGGSPGNSVYILNALENGGVSNSFTCIHDPAAVKIAASHKKDDVFNLSFGNTSDEYGGKNFTGSVKLIDVLDGKFQEKNPRHGGQVNYDMGKSVLLVTEKGNTVMINSLRIPPFSLSQLTSFGIDPETFDIITAKGVNAPIAAYGPVCKTIIQVNTPGVTQADMTRFNYKNRRKPL